MKKQRIVVALGRNAFGRTLPEQKVAVRDAASAIADLVEAKYDIIITHSNGPQVGMIHASMYEFSKTHPEYTAAPMSVCDAMSQGYIGYDLQNEIRTELLNRGIYKPVATLISQVKVDPFDRAFNDPIKTIGHYMTKEEADAEVLKGNHVVETEHGYVRAIASPKPLEIYEIDTIRTLADAGQIVIACGGGGIPVIEQGTRLKGASAIIEKDAVAALLAQETDAELLLFLSVSDQMTIRPGTPEEKVLGKLSVSEAKELVEEGHLAAESRLPKLAAAVSFVEGAPGRKAIITSIEKAKEGLAGKTGTIIVNA